LPDGRWPIYIFRQSATREMERRLDREMTPSDRRKIELRQLPLDLLHVRDQSSSVNTSKAAINDQFKTGQRSHTQDTRLFYRARGTRGKVIL
jgi:hypothetical protein